MLRSTDPCAAPRHVVRVVSRQTSESSPEVSAVTKILFIENDERTFQIRQCIARALSLGDVDLFHATDATDGLELIEELQPDVIVIDEEPGDECAMFLENVPAKHPPILVQSSNGGKGPLKRDVLYVPRCESLAALHETLITATRLARERGVTSIL